MSEPGSPNLFSDIDLQQATASLSREIALLVDREGFLVWMDERAERMCDVAIGTTFQEMLSLNSQVKGGDFLRQASTQSEARWELAIQTRIGPAVFECTSSPWNEQVLIVGSRLPEDHGSTLSEMSVLVGELSNLQRESSRQKSELQRLFLSLESANELLDREHEILETIVNRLPSGIFVAERDAGEPYLANTALEDILGVRPEGTDGLPAELVIFNVEGDLVRSADWPVCRSLDNGEAIEDEEFVITRPDGSIRTVQISSIPIADAQGRVVFAVAVFHDISHLKSLQEQLRFDSLHDALTGLPNRKMLRMKLDKLFAESDDSGEQVAVLFVDLDKFKEVNDVFGHQVGDKVLIEAARKLCSAVRTVDFVARLAGDEFIVLLTPVTGPDDAVAIARRILEVFSAPSEIDGNQLEISPSIGIALSDFSASDPDRLIAVADAALYDAKELGKSRYVLANA